MTPQPAVLTIAELAAMLRCGTRTIERGLADGTFPIPPLPSLGAGRRNRRRMWSAAVVERWIDSGGAGSRRQRR